MMLFHASELVHPTARSLHAARIELMDSKVVIPLSVAEQIAPISAGAIGTGTDLAGTLLDHHRANGSMHSSLRLAEESWWSRMWNDRNSPYAVIRPRMFEENVVTNLLDDIDPRGFPNCPPDEVHRSTEARTVCETIALCGWLCLRDDLRVIDTVEVNRWAVENGHRTKDTSDLLLYDSDTTLVNWTYKPHDIQHLVQAGLLACWPDDDDAPAGDVLRNTRSRITAMIHTGTLPRTGQRLLNCLSTHPDPIGLVEQTRELLPSPTVEAERLHPRRHERPPVPPQPPHEQKPPNLNTRETGARDRDAD